MFDHLSSNKIPKTPTPLPTSALTVHPFKLAKMRFSTTLLVVAASLGLSAVQALPAATDASAPAAHLAKRGNPCDLSAPLTISAGGSYSCYSCEVYNTNSHYTETMTAGDNAVAMKNCYNNQLPGDCQQTYSFNYCNDGKIV
ncbi:hypothetical protein BGX26_005409 [Mortierella sp. AD094]|nr:hypothetical protein BGX26_005409 [Mortierella sp. AD094]